MENEQSIYPLLLRVQKQSTPTSIESGTFNFKQVLKLNKTSKHVNISLPYQDKRIKHEDKIKSIKTSMEVRSTHTSKYHSRHVLKKDMDGS